MTDIAYIDPVTGDEVYYEDSYARSENRKLTDALLLLADMVVSGEEEDALRYAKMILKS